MKYETRVKYERRKLAISEWLLGIRPYYKLRAWIWKKRGL